MRKINFFEILLLAGTFLLLFSQSSYAKGAAAVVSDNNPVFLSALEGLKETFKNLTKVYQMEGNPIEGKKICSDIKILSPDLVIVIGDIAARAVKSNLSSDIPIVLCLVSSPEEYGSLSGNICGVSINVSPYLQLETLKKTSPNVKKVGVIYHLSRNKDLIEKANIEAQKLGLEIVAVNIKHSLEVKKAVKKLDDAKVDSLWMILDPLLATNESLQTLLVFTLANKLPFIVPNNVFVKEGGLLSISSSYKSMGQQAGKIANILISGEKTARDIGMEEPEAVETAINLKIARIIGLSISESMIKEMNYMYE